jgi:small subunit ribosomal protein S14
MAKTSTILRNENRKILVAKQRELRKELKKKAINPKLSEEDRYAARVKLQKLSPNGSKVRVKNRCQITGRARGVYQKFMLSRIKFREYAHAGLIPGVTKASW